MFAPEIAVTDAADTTTGAVIVGSFTGRGTATAGLLSVCFRSILLCEKSKLKQIDCINSACKKKMH